MDRLRFLCPACRRPIAPHSVACTHCAHELVGASGVPDFVRRPEVQQERAHYDAVYQKRARPGKRPIAAATAIWERPVSKIEYNLVRSALPPLRGSRVLLVGNGSSAKELAFLEWGAKSLVFSDLSAWGVAANLGGYELTGYEGRLIPAAIDAEDMPFEDDVFDLVYGFAVVHHLPQVQAFLREAGRVLKPGGKAVFFDDAYAPLWQWSKLTLLRPLMLYSHWKSGISPEDYRFTTEGGFKPEELARLIREINGEPWFDRAAFASYLWRRGVEKLAPRSFGDRLVRGKFTDIVDRFDRRLSSLSWWRANQIRLVWGFTKPVQRAHGPGRDVAVSA